jgi:hypothetical protein
VYDVLRSDTPEDFGDTASCLETDDADRTAADTANPSSGASLFYLVRADNGCRNTGPLGTEEVERSGRGCPQCGNDVHESGEVCDGTDLSGETCVDQGFDGGDLACNRTCDAFDTSQCSDCGNDVAESAEVCDGTDLSGESCVSQGFESGTLVCNLTCDGFDTSGCTFAQCGNDICEPGGGEDCLSCEGDCNGAQSGNPGNRYCCGDGDGENPVSCNDARCAANGNTCS